MCLQDVNIHRQTRVQQTIYNIGVTNSLTIPGNPDRLSIIIFVNSTNQTRICTGNPANPVAVWSTPLQVGATDTFQWNGQFQANYREHPGLPMMTFIVLGTPGDQILVTEMIMMREVSQAAQEEAF